MSRGNFGNTKEHQEAGHKGGMEVQNKGTAHQLTEQERAKGGSMSSGNFKNDPKRASEAGKRGGRA